MPGAPIPEGGIGESRPRQQEEAEKRDDPAVEGAAQNAAEDPEQEEDKPRGDQREKREEASHASKFRPPHRPPQGSCAMTSVLVVRCDSRPVARQLEARAKRP